MPESYVGQTVQCPQCRHQFTATPAAAVSAAPMPTQPAPAPKPKPYPREDDYDEPRRRRRYDDDDDDDLDIRDRRQIRHHLAPHRGGLILALGLISLVGSLAFCGVTAVIGPIAMILGMLDLREMRAGNMDPTGEGMTRTGMVCGIIATAFLVLGIAFFGFIFVAENF